MAVDKLTQIVKEKWWFYVDNKEDYCPDLIMFEKLLSQTFDKQRYNKHGRLTKTFKVSDEAIQTATVLTEDTVYRRPVVKLASVLSIEEGSAMLKMRFYNMLRKNISAKV